MLTREIPYKGFSVSQIIGNVGFDESHIVKIPLNGNKLIRNIMEKCLNRDPSKRPRFTEIVEEIQNGKKLIKPSKSK